MGTLFSQVLPGIRTMRTPFTVAVLWIYTALLLRLPNSPVDVSKLEAALNSIANAFKTAPDVLKVGSVGLSVYLIGVVLTSIQELLRDFTPLIIALGLLSLIFLWTPALIAFSGISITVVGIIVAIVRSPRVREWAVRVFFPWMD